MLVYVSIYQGTAGVISRWPLTPNPETTSWYVPWETRVLLLGWYMIRVEVGFPTICDLWVKVRIGSSLASKNHAALKG